MSKVSSHCRTNGTVRSMVCVATTLPSTFSTPVPPRPRPLYPHRIVAIGMSAFEGGAEILCSIIVLRLFVSGLQAKGAKKAGSDAFAGERSLEFAPGRLALIQIKLAEVMRMHVISHYLKKLSTAPIDLGAV